MMIETHRIPVTTTGTAGAATGSATSALILGELVDVYLDYGAAPATTDVTIAYFTQGGTILAIANSATDALYSPRATPVTTAGAAITNAYVPILIHDRVTVSVAGSDALDPAVTAVLRVRVR